MDVVNKIRSVPTASRPPHQNVPATPVIIERVTVIESAVKPVTKGK
jgi:peptidyl-prolyl cis-trans isomerase A (cyclophilin A)/peptidyl-prolyl cis-trans isomerase B (cyclophilin B)